MRGIARVVLTLTLTVLAAAPAAAAERFGLVIGNQGYADTVGPLRNPHKDIAIVGKALTEVGFKLLPPRKDATRDEILFAVYELANQMRTAGRDAVSFLYYAGHGIAVGGENVLIPVNAENTTDAMLSIRGVRLGEILDILKRDAPDAVHFVVLDACRTIRGRRGDRGFAPVNDRRTGVVIAFSTAPGETATDEGANAAPYALALAEEIIKPGRSDQVVFNAVRTRVVSAASGQTPWTHDGLIGERVVFKTAPVATAPAAVAPPPTQPRLSEAAEAWAAADRTNSIPALEAFIRRFGDTYYGDLAGVRLGELRQAEIAKQTAEAAKKKVEEEARAKENAERQRLTVLQEEELKRRRPAEASLPLNSVWKGWHECGGRKVGTTAHISIDNAGQVRGTREFYATAGDSNRASGSFRINGFYRSDSGEITLHAGDWISRPPGYGKCDFIGRVDAAKSRIIGHSPGCSCGAFELTRQ